jgi:anti-sigma factor RsiW
VSKITFTIAELEAYLDEALSPQEMANMETVLRDRPDLLRELALINNRRDAGVHTIGEIWRRNRLSCFTREQLGSFLLGTLPDEQRNYVQFHIQTIGCRFCLANYADLQREQEEAVDVTEQRRSRYFQSSAGQLRKGRKS